MCWLYQESGHFLEYNYFIYIINFEDSLFDSISCTKKVGSLRVSPCQMSFEMVLMISLSKHYQLKFAWEGSCLRSVGPVF